MSNEIDTSKPPLKYDEMLLSNARLASHYYESELRFSGYNTPSVLFSGVHGEGAKIRFNADSLNPNKALMWFTPTLKLAGTFGEKLDEQGQLNQDNTSRLILVVFPHESTDLGKWVFQETPGKERPILEFITNQDLPLEKSVVTTLERLLAIPIEKQSVIKDRDSLLEILVETNSQQEELRKTLRDNYQNK